MANSNKHVKTENDYHARRVAKNLLAAISENGGHAVRLIDVSGKPGNPKNVANDDFEKEGVRRLKYGTAYFEKIVKRKNQSYLRAITHVPVVMSKCTLCHPNYKTVPKGAAIGALSYTVEIE